MKKAFNNWYVRWHEVSNPEFVTSLSVAGVLLILSMLASTFANTYATAHAGFSVPDLILSHLGPMNVFLLYAYGPMLFGLVFLLAVLAYPKTIPFAIKALALFFIVRSACVCLTNVGIPAGEFIPPHAPGFLKHYFFGGDLFFSGHAGMPFLFAMVYRRFPFLKWFFLATAVVLSFVVLAGHYHYTIDVIGALFITPWIYIGTRKLFPRDFELLRQAR